MCVSYASVSRWENGQSRPSTLAWQRILRSEAMGIEALSINNNAHYTVKEPEIPHGAYGACRAAHTADGGSEKVQAPDTDFSSDPEIVRVVAEGERLTYGYLFNPVLATEISLVDPLPHQRIAVYEHMLHQPRLRFLLADDAGAGKTIMTGLYIREMLSRQFIHRVLIIPPAGLVGNWEREMRSLFSLPFRVVAGSQARSTNNPFVGSDSGLLIISVDTLCGERMFSCLQDSLVAPYDLVIFDEAHKLSADQEPDFRIRKTDRYRLAEALAGAQNEDPRWRLDWSCQHLLLLTATPHMGKDFPYYCLWKLLEPEVFSTFKAFQACPAESRKRHFIRRTKEEMVRFDGSPIYPTRTSDTLSYELSQGDVSEQKLYDETTRYLQVFYNRARILNRSAARLAMSIFQRRLASSTYALMKSFERRLKRLDGLIDDIRSGRITPEQLAILQQKLENIRDLLDERTADEEDTIEGREEHEIAEDRAFGGVTAVTLAELEAERLEVQSLFNLAQRVHEAGEDSKFEKLHEIVQDPRYKNEKIIIFTEHKDTLDFLLQSFERFGFTGKVARIHGGLPYQEREEQIEFFRKSPDDGGATYLIATDAAGEGINLQFCWLMVNYDIPWNPARLEQRMGRIHRYGQKHDPVIIMNLVAGSTREGRVLKTLLEKLERIRKELGSDKVFDVIGRMFEGVSLKEYMEEAVTEEGADAARKRIEWTMTKEQVQALREREQRLFGDGGDVRRELPRLQKDVEQETYHRLLPGYVRHFIEKAAPLVDLGLEGNLDGCFHFTAQKPAALDLLWPALETYPPPHRSSFTVYRPKDTSEAIFLHPGDLFFDHFREYVCSRLKREALKGGIFQDPTAHRPYLFHLLLITIERRSPETNVLKGQSSGGGLETVRVLQYRLIGLRQEETGHIEACPVEHLLLLKGGCDHHFPLGASLAAAIRDFKDMARTYVIEHIARPLAESHRQSLRETLAERESFLRKGYDYQEAELAAIRARISAAVRLGDPGAKGEHTRIRERQRRLIQRRDEALARLGREPELIAPGEVMFLAHALVIPSQDPDDIHRRDEDIEAIAVRVAWSYEETRGATVKDVSKPEGARCAGLSDRPGFDLLSAYPDGRERAIEVKGRAGTGDIEITENEWISACNLRDRYWLYVVFECATPYPRLIRVQDPFRKLVARTKGGVIVDERSIFEAAEGEQ